MARHDELINATPRLILYVSSQVFDRRGTCWTIKKKETSQQTGGYSQLLLLLRGRQDSSMQCRVLSNFYDDRQDIICSPRTRRQVLIFPLRITRDMHRVDIIMGLAALWGGEVARGRGQASAGRRCYITDEAERLLLLGLACTNPNPSSRRSMVEAVEVITAGRACVLVAA